jgi:hypothetical protein
MSDDTLLRMASQLGEIQGTLAGLDSKVTSHIAQSTAVEKRVASLEHTQAAQRGALKMALFTSTSIGSLLGALVSWVLHNAKSGA